MCHVYGTIEEVSYASYDLLWKPTGSLIRFVLALTSHGPIVLMCSDLTGGPLCCTPVILYKYSHRSYV